MYFINIVSIPSFENVILVYTFKLIKLFLTIASLR